MLLFKTMGTGRHSRSLIKRLEECTKRDSTILSPKQSFTQTEHYEKLPKRDTNIFFSLEKVLSEFVLIVLISLLKTLIVDKR